ncbi:ADP-ribosylglycohydrolase [Fomitiporia mediterranea MF3/22]|uniref:ADP-ribosylglycohydrolase n=1 Tax=Fomitiporia mediterranea (strain MF3/22) TaxID=694068 RepID=UPI000440745B|nr:ADP-ribosylglycohydrolase [Fomitiporia mediterranea MF3/22]EJD00432.1 ADP-ribosylglycohydrolase [Fomitiporia mediterranea MF3/22]
MSTSVVTTVNQLRSHLKGALYGLAVGDALGAPYEFRTRGNYAVSGMMEASFTFTLPDGRPMEPGTWTDDTSTALCLAESLNEKGKLEWEDVAKKLVKWYEEGYMSAVGYCFDIGNATREALGIYSSAIKSGNNFTLSGSSNPYSSGNGSLMRLSPVPVFYQSNPREALAMSDMQSRITHASHMCLESCRLATAQFLGFFALARNSSNTSTLSLEEAEERKEMVLSADYLPAGVTSDELSFATEEVKALRAGTWKTKSVKQIKTSGFVIHSHEAALWALWNSKSFEEGMLLLLPLGSDVDTVCAIYGQLAGALYGIEAIPERWLNALQRKDVLERVFDTLVETSVS